jgi:hypothetical protein
MSLSVRCTITIDNQKYESGVVDGRALEAEGGFGVAPATFARTPKKQLEGYIDVAIEGAKKEALRKLSILKGEE